MGFRREIDNPVKVVQVELVRNFFVAQEHAISCAEAADALLEEHQRLTGRAHFYVGSIIRRLHKEGFLIRIKRGVYQYNPYYIVSPRGKRHFIRLYYAAKRAEDENRMQLYRQILRSFDDYNIHREIEWRE
jgi:hypothetical protein